MKSLANQFHSQPPATQQANRKPSALRVNSVGDRYEREADAMARQVMEKSEGKSADSSGGLIGRSLNRTGMAGPGMIMRKAQSEGSHITTGGMLSHPGQAREGTVLPSPTRNFMEHAFSADFASVRVHTGPEADRMNRKIGATAFTYGEHIYFRQGAYAPNYREGRKLLAHELTHVVQQRTAFSGPHIQRQAAGTTAAPAEQENVIVEERIAAFLRRLNAQSTAIRYRLVLPRIVYDLVNQAALTEFDQQMRSLIDLGETFYVRMADLLTNPQNIEGSENIPALVKLDNLLRADNESFQTQLISFFSGPLNAPATSAETPDIPTPDTKGATPELPAPEEVSARLAMPEVAETSDAETDTGTEVVEAIEPVETPAGKATASEEGETGAAGGVVLSPEPLMPEAPSELGKEAQQRLSQAQSGAGRAASSSRQLPAATEMTGDAREGVTEPPEETKANASAELTGTLKERPAPSPQIEELCAKIKAAIEAKRPPDEDSLLEADPKGAADEVGSDLNDNISKDADNVNSGYDEMDNPGEGQTGQVGVAPDVPSESYNEGEINAEGAAPDPVEVSLDEDVENTDRAISDAGMNTEVANAIDDPNNPVVSAREGQGELEQTAAEDPAVVMARQDEAIASAQGNMQDLQAKALAALQNSRSGAVSGGSRQQTALIGTEEEKRAAVGRRAEGVFSQAQRDVNDLLQPLTRTAMSMWNAGKEKKSTEFKQHLAKVQSWVDERHSGVGGFFVGIADAVTGLPGWVTEEYDDAEKTFSDGVCDLIREISTYVNSIIMACEEIIDQADKDIAKIFEDARGELGDWVDQQREGFSNRLNSLKEQVYETRDNFNKDLANQAAQAVQEVREEVHALREAAKGLIGQIADAIAAFVEDPVKFIIEGLLKLVGIAPASFWALVNKIEQVIADIADDPMNFANNLMEAIGKGFNQFFDNFGTHLLGGLVEWLFSGLGAMGIQVPTEFSLSSVISFFLQLMGFTWARIRQMLVKHIGPQNVEWIEQAVRFMMTLIEMGPQGIYEMIREQLNPQNILDIIIQTAIDFLVEAIVKQVAVRLLLLLNPVGAIAQVMQAIYTVLKWLFQNAARIFTLIETVVNGMAAIIAGNIGGMANAVEKALRKLLVPVIDFVAEFLGLGALPEKVAKAVKGMQDWIATMLDKAIGWLAKKAKDFLKRLGIGGKEDGEADDKLEDSEVGETIRFTANEELHSMWIVEEGGGVEVMMKSKTKSVGTQLAEWKNNIDGLSEDNEETGKQALSLGEQKYQEVKKEGSEAKKEIDEAKTKPEPKEIEQAEQADQDTEEAEHELAIPIKDLIELMGEEPLSEKYKSQLAKVDEKAASDIKAELEENHKVYAEKNSWEEVRQLLIDGDSKVKGLHDKPLGTSSAPHDFGENNFNTLFVPAVSNAVENLKKDNKSPKVDDPSTYATHRKGVIHGSPPPEGEQGSLNARQNTLQKLQEQIFNGDREDTSKAMVEYFEHSLEGKTTHRGYKPQNIKTTIEDGSLVITYDYGEEAEKEGGRRDFTVLIRIDDVDENTGTQMVLGEGLALKVPGTRGYTASSGTYGSAVDTRGVNIDSAHLLADQFMGSGYKAALNLVLTSDKFNRETMYNAEASITGQITDIQKAHKEKLVTFNMVVEATWKAVKDDPILEHLKAILPSKTDNLSEEELKTLAEETRQNLSSKQDPRVCEKVTYFAELFGNGHPLGEIAEAETAHEDKWLAEELFK